MGIQEPAITREELEELEELTTACYKCARNLEHVWHDNGEPADQEETK